MVQVIKAIFYFGPLLFGIGFLAPLSAQIIQAMGWTPPFGLTPLMTGLILGGAYGLLAQIRGRWV
ncbi:MAG: hypothetical protein HRT81_16395 [Henriciella sp.]|nr:hypothetical protein [Henriciella sp.]